MLNAAVIGLGWWGKRLVQSVQGSRGDPLVAWRVTLEPELVGELRGRARLAIGTSFEEGCWPIARSRRWCWRRRTAVTAPRSRRRPRPASMSIARSRSRCARTTRRRCSPPARAPATLIGVGHHFRLMPSMKALAAPRSGGRHARRTVMHAEGHYSHDRLAALPAGRLARRAGGDVGFGGMTGMGIHLLDCFRDLVGPMRRISALVEAPRARAGDRRHHRGADRVRRWGDRHACHSRFKTLFMWRLAVYGENAWAESAGRDAAGGPPRRR